MVHEYVYFTKKKHEQIPIQTGTSNDLSMIMTPEPFLIEQAISIGASNLFVYVDGQTFLLKKTL